MLISYDINKVLISYSIKIIFKLGMSMKLLDKSFLQDWALDNSELIKDINKYITGDDLMSVTSRDLHELITTFPQFAYEGRAYRFLSKDKELNDLDLEHINFENSHPNRSWSLEPNAYKSVLKSYGKNNQVVFLYEAQISFGFNLVDFALFLWKNDVEVFNRNLGLLEKETEILVLNYSSLQFVEKLYFSYG